MGSKTWQEIVAEKKSSLPPFPAEWKIKEEVLSELTKSATASVLDAPTKCGVLSAEDVDITENYTATKLLGMMRERKISSKTVTTAFCKRAAVAHQLVSTNFRTNLWLSGPANESRCKRQVNCLTETFFDKAIERAEYLDSYLAEHGKVIGPLHGIPISLKVIETVSGSCMQ